MPASSVGPGARTRSEAIAPRRRYRCLRIGEVQARLVLEPDERQHPVEDLASAGLVPGHVAPDDVDEELREPEPGHRPGRAAAQLLEEHDRPEAAQDAQVRVGREQPADLGRARFVLELDHAARRRLVGDVDQQVDAHVDAAARRVVLDDDRQLDRVGDREVVRERRRASLGFARAGGASITEWAPIACASRAKATARSVPGWVTPTQTGRSPAASMTPADDLTALVVGELRCLAEHAEDRHAVDAAAAGRTRSGRPGSRHRAPRRGGTASGTMFQTPRSRSSATIASAVCRFAGHVVGRARQDREADRGEPQPRAVREDLGRLGELERPDDEQPDDADPEADPADDASARGTRASGRCRAAGRRPRTAARPGRASRSRPGRRGCRRPRSRCRTGA